jgi:hypothetical protein
VLGCSSSSPSPSSPSPGSGASDDAAAGSLDGSGGADDADGGGADAMFAGTGDASSPAGLPTTFSKYGTVGARWTHGGSSAATDVTDTAVVFIDYGALGTCTRTTVDSCVHVHCPTPDGGGLPTETDPGSVQIGASPVQMTLPFQGPMGSTAKSVTQELWPPGTSVPMTSPGSAAVPAWSTSVTMPPMATVTSPMIASTVMNFSRQNDFPVDWTGSPDIVVSLQSSAIGAEQLACTFSGGHGVMPASMFGLLPVGSYDLEIFTAYRQYFLAGDWSIRATADTTAACPNGMTCQIEQFNLE